MNADGDVLEAYAYDAAGNVVKKVNAKNGAGSQDISLLTGEEYTYDNYDNLISTKDYLGNTTTFEYDLKGNLTAATDAKNQKTQYAYCSDNTLARVDFPNGGYSIYTYDLKGRQTGETIAPVSYTHLLRELRSSA